MKPISQAEVHPDADSLNAFAEQALAAPERERILAHIAGCGRCRQVVFLAQQAAADAEAALVPAAGAANRPGAWRRRWRLAWVPAAALASMVALVVTFHPWHAAPGPNASQSALPAEGKSAPSPLSPKPALPELRAAAAKGATGRAGHEEAAGNAAGRAAAKTVARANSAARRRPVQEVAVDAAPAAAPPALPDRPALSIDNAALSAAGAFGPGPEPRPVPAQPQPQTAVAAWRQEQMAGAAQKKAAAAPRADRSLHGTEGRFQGGRTMAAAVPRPQLTAAYAGSIESGAFNPATGQVAPLQPSAFKMPSGLMAVSTATAWHHMLAIDRAGALFLSEDQGKNWQPVQKQWTGRALAVKAQAGTSAGPELDSVFQMTCDNGSTWVSADGKSWRAQ
jgi:hypothetical protein